MRGQPDAWMLPVRVFFRGWFIVEHVENRLLDLPGWQRFKQVGFHQVAAASEVDQPGAVGQGGEGFGVENPASVGGQRQQANQQIALIQKRDQLLIAGKAEYTLDVFFRARPATQFEAKGP